MMTDSEKLNIIVSEMRDMKSDMQGIKEEIQGMKSDMQDMKEDMQGMKSDMQGMKSDMQGMKAEINDVSRRVDGIELHLENETDKNIQLLAENFIELTNKLNQAIPAADKNLAYEVKVNYLVGRVNNLEKDMTELKVRAKVMS